MLKSRIETRPTSGAVGAEIFGLDLSNGLDDSDVGELRAALNRYGVIFFRDQTISPEQQIAFAERFGTININRFFKAEALGEGDLLLGGYRLIAKEDHDVSVEGRAQF